MFCIWFNNSASNGIELVGIFMNFILTIFLIILTRKISNRQNTLDKRKIKLDLFPYRRELILNAYRAIEFALALKTFIIDKYKNEYLENISIIIQIYKRNIKICFEDKTLSNIIFSLQETNYLMNKETSKKINIINNALTEIDSNLSKIEINHLSKDLSNIDEYIKNIEKYIDEINSQREFILDIMPIELNIINLDEINKKKKQQ